MKLTSQQKTKSLYELGKQAARKNAPGSYMLNDDAAPLIGQFKKGSKEWYEAIKEYTNGFSTERLRVMGQ